MSDPDKNALIEHILTRASDKIGDITAPVMALFYQRFPQARQMFEHHGSDRVYNLEGEMVQQALYCLMYWFDSPGEVEIVLWGSVPHHNDTLKVPPEIYQGLLTATSEVIFDTIPPERDDERTVWKELCDDLGGLIEHSRQYVTDPKTD